MGQTDAVGLRHETEQRAVAIETPRAALLDDFDARLVVPVENLLGDPSGGRAVDQRKRPGTVPLHVHNGHNAVRNDATDRRVGLEVFEFHWKLVS